MQLQRKNPDSRRVSRLVAGLSRPCCRSQVRRSRVSDQGCKRVVFDALCSSVGGQSTGPSFRENKLPLSDESSDQLLDGWLW